jgi:hypothetical protein
MNSREVACALSAEGRWYRQSSEHEAKKDVEGILDEREFEFIEKEIEEELEGEDGHEI